MIGKNKISQQLNKIKYYKIIFHIPNFLFKFSPQASINLTVLTYVFLGGLLFPVIEIAKSLV